MLPADALFFKSLPIVIEITQDLHGMMKWNDANEAAS